MDCLAAKRRCEEWSRLPSSAAESEIMVQSLKTRRPNVRLVRRTAESRQPCSQPRIGSQRQRTRRHRKHHSVLAQIRMRRRRAPRGDRLWIAWMQVCAKETRTQGRPCRPPPAGGAPKAHPFFDFVFPSRLAPPSKQGPIRTPSRLIPGDPAQTLRPTNPHVSNPAVVGRRWWLDCFVASLLAMTAPAQLNHILIECLRAGDVPCPPRLRQTAKPRGATLCVPISGCPSKGAGQGVSP